MWSPGRPASLGENGYVSGVYRSAAGFLTPGRSPPDRVKALCKSLNHLRLPEIDDLIRFPSFTPGEGAQRSRFWVCASKK